MLHCFSERCTKDQLIYTIETPEYTDQLLKRINTQISTNDIPCNINKKYVTYKPNINDNVLCIKSHMGSGKTQILENIITQYNHKYIVYISTRKSFTQDILQRFAAFNFTSYQDIDSGIEYYIKTGRERIILQIDSLARISKWRREDILFILDEYQSICTQLSTCSTRTVQVFIDILKSNNKLIILDGQLNNNTLDIVRTYRTIDHYINNAYQPYKNNTIITRPYNNRKEQSHLYQQILTLLQEGKKIISNINSVSTAKTIKQKLTTLKYNVLLIHGDDTLVEDNSEYHITYKMNVLNNINTYLQTNKPDIFIYTSTLTNGVNISIEYFDTFVHCYQNFTTQSDLFIQSMFRNRIYRDKQHYLYLRNCNTFNKTCPYQLYKEYKL